MPTPTTPTVRRVAVLGAGGPMGTAVLQELAGCDGLDLLAVDASTPGIVPPRAGIAVCDSRDRLLPLTLAGVDVVVHAPTATPLDSSPDALHGLNVGGTRNVLDAAARSGVTQVVVVISAAAYGAGRTDAVALAEDAPLRANPGYPHALQQQLIDEMVQTWQVANPDVVVTRLRVAPVLGAAEFGGLSDRLLAPRLMLLTGAEPRWQFAHPGDVASAVGLVVQRRLEGVFNVASRSFIETADVARLVQRDVALIQRPLMEKTLVRMRRLGISGATADLVHFLGSPPVLDGGRLEAQGWHPAHSNEDVLTEFAARNRDVVSLGRWRPTRPTARQAGLAGVGLLAAVLWRMIRR